MLNSERWKHHKACCASKYMGEMLVCKLKIIFKTYSAKTM